MNWRDTVDMITNPARRPDSTVNAGGDQPDRMKRAQVACSHADYVTDEPCGWEGIADVAVFDDTSEALWWCPDEHENSERYGDYS